MILKRMLQMTVAFLIACPLSASLVYFSDPHASIDNLVFNSIDWKNLSELEKNKYSLWFRDSIKQNLQEQHFYCFNQLLAIGQTSFQDYAVIDTSSYGKILFIDGELQSSQDDEFIYHESLVHPAMIAHPNPKSILIIGAGEGAAAREVLRHPSVESLVLVDIDGEIIQKSKDLLGEWHQGSFDHPKTQLLIMDGKAYVESKQKKFDIIYIDICDKLEADSPVTDLYSKNFYRSLKEILNPGGIVVVQAMEFDAKVSKDHLMVHRNLRKVFTHTFSSGTYVPSFWAPWGFVVASDSPYLANISVKEIDIRLKERGLSEELRHYDGETHQHMFSIPKSLRNKLKKVKK